ncbi:MAG TPA: VOC family protein [Sphingomicrobium sp.]|nr:VOC family protein [Sphingomicrobium sp.]
MPVLGMGGYFFRAEDPDKLKAWYRDHLGVGGGCGADDNGQSNDWLWYQQAGPTVFEPFKAATDYFPADRTAMINLRVRDLDALLGDLRAAGIEIMQEQAMDGVGRFARIHDPEGNPVELWEPS